MPRMVNTADNTVVEVPHTSAAEGFLSGKLNLRAGEPVVMLDQRGQLMQVEPKDVHTALQDQGYTFASPEHIKEADLQSQYGEGVGAQAKAFGLGAADVLSFGGASQILGGTGAVSQEALKELPERNPVSYAAGQVAGIAIPIPGTAPSLIAKAGLGASEALLKALPAATSVGGRIAANAARVGLGSAVEGALYGAGTAVTEHALGDPNFTAERVAAHIGLGALFGGALGTALGAGQIAVPEAVSAARRSMESVRDKALGLAGDRVTNAYTKAAAFVSGKPEEDIITALANRHTFVNSPEEVRKYSDELSGALQKQYETINKASADAFKAVRPEESSKLAARAEAGPIYDKLSQVDSTLQEVIADMRSKPELYPSRFPSKLEDIAAGFTRDVVNGNSAEAGFKALDDLKSNLSKNIKFGKIPAEESLDAIGAIKSLRHTIKEALEDTSVFGEAGVRQAQFNDAFSTFKTAQKEFEKKFTLGYVTKTGQATRKVDAVKVNTFLNSMGDVRGQSKSEILKAWSDSSKTLLDQIEHSYANLPSKEFESGALKDVLQRTHGITEEVESRAAIKRAFDRLSKSPNSEVGAALAASVAHAAGVPYAVAAPLVGMYEILRNPGTAIQRLAKLESIVNRADQTMSRGASSLFKATSEKANRTAGFLGAKVGAAQFDKSVKSINEITQSPEVAQEKLEAMTKDTHSAAPSVSAGMQQTALRGMQFLKSKIPVAPATYPLQAKWTPSSSDVAQFNKYYDAVQNPLGVFEQMQAGALTHETMEALHIVYPKLYEQMRSHVFDAMTSHKGAIPYHTKVQLSLFLGQDLTASTSAHSIMSNQKALLGGFNQMMQTASQGIKPTSKGASGLTSNSRMQTPSQQSASRR